MYKMRYKMRCVYYADHERFRNCFFSLCVMAKCSLRMFWLVGLDQFMIRESSVTLCFGERPQTSFLATLTF